MGGAECEGEQMFTQSVLAYCFLPLVLGEKIRDLATM